MRRFLNPKNSVAAALLLLATPAGAQTLLKITRLPAGTPAQDSLFVAGSFNGWNPRSAAYALRRNAEGIFQIALPVSLGKVAYKFTRGSWSTGEADAKGTAVANREADLSQGGEVLHQVAGWADFGPANPTAKAHTASPQVHVLAEAFPMPQLGRKRRVLIYLPADYAKRPNRRYPVLYMHDGQNVFDAATSFSGEWGVDETLDRLHATGQDAKGCIVVAINNGDGLRGDEYIPWRNPVLKMGGEGTAYVDFLAQTLKPYLDRHYRTVPDAAHTGVAGSSLGGLISVYAALKYPRIFGRVGVFSPAFWVCNDSLLRYASRRPAARATKFYFVCGPNESETMLPLMTAWRDKLLGAGVPAANVSFHAPTDGAHSEWFWQREFPAAYRWLFMSPSAGMKQLAAPVRSTGFRPAAKK